MNIDSCHSICYAYAPPGNIATFCYYLFFTTKKIHQPRRDKEKERNNKNNNKIKCKLFFFLKFKKGKKNGNHIVYVNFLIGIYIYFFLIYNLITFKKGSYEENFH